MTSETELEYLKEGISRKSPLLEWEKWARILVRDYPTSCVPNVFASSFLHGLGPQNVKKLRELDLLISCPNPDPEGLIKTNRILDPVGVILLMHEIEVPISSRLIVTDFFYERGLLVVDKAIKYYESKESEY